jgi:hypothetical protein
MTVLMIAIQEFDAEAPPSRGPRGRGAAGTPAFRSRLDEQ